MTPEERIDLYQGFRDLLARAANKAIHDREAQEVRPRTGNQAPANGAANPFLTGLPLSPAPALTASAVRMDSIYMSGGRAYALLIDSSAGPASVPPVRGWMELNRETRRYHGISAATREAINRYLTEKKFDFPDLNDEGLPGHDNTLSPPSPPGRRPDSAADPGPGANTPAGRNPAP